MSWSDDTRCLFCDGKLPLYRKLAQGQFCSKAHQEAYWKEQDALAVESLHRTHDALQAYKPAVSIESILGPAPVVAAAPVAAPKFLDTDPPFAGLLPQTDRVGAVRTASPSMVAGDPVEHELVPAAAIPFFAGEPGEVEAPAETLDLSEIETGLYGLQPFEARNIASPFAIEARLPEGPADQAAEVPAFDLAVDVKLAAAGQVAWQPLAAIALEAIANVTEALTFAETAPSAPVHYAAPIGDALEELEAEAYPLVESSFGLAQPSIAAGAFLGARGGEAVVEFEGSLPVQPNVVAFALPAYEPNVASELFALAELQPASFAQAPLVGEVRPVDTQVLAPAHGVSGLRIEEAGPFYAWLQHLPEFAATDTATVVSAQPAPLELPLSAAHVPTMRAVAAPLAVRVHAEEVFPLNLMDRVRPSAGSYKARGPVVAIPVERDALLPRLHSDIAGKSPAFLEARALMNAPASKQLLVGAMNFWNHAPRDLKILLFAVPVAVGLAFHPALPKVSVQAPANGTKDVPGMFQNVVSTQVASLKKAIADRAAIGLDENFRQGLDSWMGNSGSTAEWSFDQAGFVQPGRVALYQPSLGLSDYEMQFLGAIDKGALSWVVRAADFQNYYVVKLVVLKSGAIPQLGITRYAVINGQAVDRVDTPVFLNSRTDSLYRVSMAMQGDHYSLTLQGQVIDAWTEKRLKHGGVGFFTNRGEQSRIGWVQITHQYDTLGRLFAYLAP